MFPKAELGWSSRFVPSNVAMRARCALIASKGSCEVAPFHMAFWGHKFRGAQPLPQLWVPFLFFEGRGYPARTSQLRPRAIGWVRGGHPGPQEAVRARFNNQHKFSRRCTFPQSCTCGDSCYGCLRTYKQSNVSSKAQSSICWEGIAAQPIRKAKGRSDGRNCRASLFQHSKRSNLDQLKVTCVPYLLFQARPPRTRRSRSRHRRPTDRWWDRNSSQSKGSRRTRHPKAPAGRKRSWVWC
jgi:hypothetical protein